MANKYKRKSEPLNRWVALVMALISIFIGTVFSSTLFSNQPIAREDATELTCIYKEFIVRTRRSSLAEIKLLFYDASAQYIDGCCVKDELVETLEKTPIGTEFQMLVNPKNNYILELIVAHELTHIWHCHKLWKSAVLRTRGATASHIEDEILSEMVCLEKNYSEQYEDGTLTDIEAFSIDRGHIICESVADKNFIQQILEIDADCCAMCIVIANLQKEMEPIAIAYNSDPEKSKNKIRAIISCHSYLLGLIAGAAGLMCGFFDSQRTGATFERLSYLLSSDHPIPAVRFFKMNVTLNDNDIAEMLLSSTDAFSVDIFMHKDHVMDLKNCFWAPVQTREAQEFITLLEKGWNLIHDSLQSFALLEIPGKLSAEDLVIPDRLVWFDGDGNAIRKSWGNYLNGGI